MKTLLIPALALTLASLPAHAQKTKEPEAQAAHEAKIAAEATAVERPVLPATSLGLLRRVQFNDAALSEVIEYLNAKLAEQKGEPLNVVVSAGLESTKVPTILLQNVSATDVLNVVAKMIGLTVEPVPSDSGKVAAWIITKGRPFNAMRGGNFMHDAKELGADGGGGAEADFQYKFYAPSSGSADGPSPNPPASALAEGGMPGRVTATAPLAEWRALSDSAPSPAQVSRVLGIGKIYEDTVNSDERAKKEAELSDMLSVISRDQKLECKVKFYDNLHVIVLKGTPEAVALIEQTVAAMKENAGGKMPSRNAALRP